MSLWVPVLAACAAAYALKVAGYLVPSRWLAGPRAAAVLTLLPVCLLAALVVVQAATDGQRLVLDARAVGLFVAAVALLARAPFLVVVVTAVVVTALVRALAG